MTLPAFNLLGLPLRKVEPEELAEAYQSARRLWFFRQFDPEYLLEAADELAKVDEAYRLLKDPRRQAILLRQSLKPKPTKAPRMIDERTEDQPREAGSRPPVHRPRLARQLLMAAEKVVEKTGHALNTDERKQLTRIAYEAGLAYADAQQFVEKIAAKVDPEPNRPSFGRSPA